MLYLENDDNDYGAMNATVCMYLGLVSFVFVICAQYDVMPANFSELGDLVGVIGIFNC